jgi:electron transfer flavoprotein alpha subunit
VAYEILAQGRKLADQLGEQLSALVLGDQKMTDIESLCHYGVDRVLCCRHHLLSRYTTDGFTNVIAAVIAKEKPSIVLYGATPNGRDLAPRVAARMRLGLTADCTELGIDEHGQLVQTRPAFGGNIMATIISPYTRPQTATVRPNVFAAADPDPTRPVNIEEVPVTLTKANIRTRLIEEILLDSEEERIEEAKIIVSAGRGCQDPVNLDTVRELARKLGGVLAGSRAIVELGWIPHSLQVGQSGTTVGPELYIAVGISGAVQHLVGMSSSKKVIAINKDPNAPIFKIADLGIVGDAQVILPKLINEIERIKVLS